MFFKEKDEPIVSSKSSFYFGLATGIAIVSTLGLLIINGQNIKNLNLNQDKNNPEAVNSGDEAENNDGDQAAKPTNPAPSNDGNTEAVDVKVSDTDHIRGKKNAPITIVEFSDYQCPFCQRFHETMKQVMQNYPNQVRWVFKHFPLSSIHPYAQKAAEAAECAGEQNKFWEYTDEIYANQSSLNNDYLAKAAQNLNLNLDKFNSCLSSGKMAKRVSADLSQGQSLGVRGTPGSFINGKSIPGAVPYSTIDEMIKAELNK